VSFLKTTSKFGIYKTPKTLIFGLFGKNHQMVRIPLVG
jgi:hypothetical protein